MKKNTKGKVKVDVFTVSIHMISLFLLENRKLLWK